MVNIKDKDDSPSTSKNPPTPRPLRRDPSLPASLPTFYKPDKVQGVVENKTLSSRRRCLKFLYDRDKKTFCGRTCKNWISIIIYSTMYLISLAAYFLLFLYGTLMIMKELIDFKAIDKIELLTYSNAIGISGTPTAVNNQPLISYTQGDEKAYKIYVDSIERLLAKNRKKRDTRALGPCGEAPYGYGDDPCVILKINKQLYWEAKPLSSNSSETKLAPKQVQNWVRRDRKLWHFCEGHTSFEKEHLNAIKYYPDPPGIEPDLFPIDLRGPSPLVAIQLTNITMDVSLVIECKLWYEGGPSTFHFVIYVSSE